MPRGSLVALAGCLLLAVGCATGGVPSVVPRPTESAGTIRVGFPDGPAYRVVRMPLDDYVAAVAVAETDLRGVDPRAAGRMLEVQVLLARTYATAGRGRHAREGFDVCATTHCQVALDPAQHPAARHSPARTLARRTQGLGILYRGQPIEAVYHAHCGGHTSAGSDVWQGEGSPYLKGAADRFCVTTTRAAWHWTVEAGPLRDAVRGLPGGSRLDRVVVRDRDPAGRAVTLTIGEGRTVRAADFRLAIMKRFGPATLKSTRFEVTRRGNGFEFRGEGHGHGVGLCQAGALARAQAGESPAAILQHYFPGTSIGRLRPAPGPSPAN